MHKVLLIALLTASACGTVRQVSYDYDKTVAFQNLKTYAWAPQATPPYKDSRYRNEILDNNIKTYVSQQFDRLGLKVDPTNPDILLSYDLQVEKGEYTREDPVYAQAPPMMGAGQFWMGNPMFNHPLNFRFWNGPMMGGMWMPPPQVVGYRTRQIPFKSGTLIISANKRADNRLIWRGWAESCIMDPVAYKENLESKTADLVKTYPARRVGKGQ